MSPFRHLLHVVRGRRLLAAGAFLFLAYLFANNLSSRPRYVVQTGAKLDRELFRIRGPAYWGTVEHLSDDGRQVTVGVHEGDFRGYSTRLEVWDTRTGTDQTPAHWQEEDWQNLLTGGMNWSETGLMDLLSNPSGREFLHDAAAWAALRKRLAVGREKALEDLQRTIRPLHEGEGRAAFPASIRFSPDGGCLSYVLRHGWPVYGSISDSLGDATAVEDTRTGRRIATLPGVTDDLFVAPGGRTAISHISANGDGEQPRLILWDLERSRRRVELLCPDRPRQIGYSPGGRYVYATGYFSSELLRWWDADTGKVAGEVYATPWPEFPDGDRALVIVSRDDQTLHCWDMTTGRPLADREFDQPADGRLNRLRFSGGGRYLLADFDPVEVPATKTPIPVIDKVADWLVERLPDSSTARERTQTLLLDAVDSRPLGRVSGASGLLSSNGHWLATLDADGVVRVWDLPLGRPWGRGFAYAAAVFVCAWVVVGLRRRWRRGRPGAPLSAPERGVGGRGPTSPRRDA